MLKIKLNKVWIGLLLYVTLLVISFFFEVSTILSLRSPNSNNAPYNNFIPFNTIVNYIFNFNHYNISTWLYNVLGNILIFTPLGILIPSLVNNVKRYIHIIYIALPISVTIEILQYITILGVFDIDDIILNLTGSIIGFYVYLKIKK